MEECRLKIKNRESKRVKSYEGSASKGFKTTLDSRRDSPIKFHQNFQRLVMRGCLIPKSLKGRGNSSPTKKPSCGSVVRIIIVSALLGWTIALDVARVDRR